MEQNKDRLLHIRMTQQDFDRLDRLARYTRRTRSNTLRWLIATAQFNEPEVVHGKGDQGDDKGE